MSGHPPFAAQTPQPKTFDPDTLVPYFSQVGDGRAAAALAEDKLDEALPLFNEIAANADDVQLKTRARFVAAFLAERLGQNERAFQELPRLASKMPLVADVGWQRAAVAAYRLGRFKEAADYAGRVRLSSVFAGDAVMLRADSLRQASQITDALGVYDYYMSAFPSGRRRLEATSRAVSCLVDLAQNTPHGDTAARQALSLIQQLRAQAPSSRWTDAAESYEEPIRQQLGLERTPERKNRRAALALYEKGTELMRQMRNERAEKVFNRLIRMTQEESQLWCRAQSGRGLVISRQRDHERAALAFSEIAQRCSEPEIRVRALYRAGKSFQAAGQLEDAVTMFTNLENEYSTHSYADDARLRAARCRLDQGRHDDFLAMLESLPDDYPSGDMRAEALWTLSLDAIDRSEYERAHRVLTRYYNLFPKETGWYAAGRSGYWLARIEEQLGLLENAANHYEHVLATAPLSYYMVLAYNRLENLDAARAQSALKHLSPKPAESRPVFHSRLLQEHPTLASSIELMRLGLTTLGGKELEHVLVDPNLPNEAHWLVAHVLRRMERFEDLRQITELAGDDWKTRYPTGPDFERWCLAYPQAYEDKVAKAAEKNAIPKELVWAIMREESSFDPNVESWANAMGLMQLILPTARSMGRQLGIRVNRHTLRRPDVNIALGTAYLGYLKDRMDSHPALIIAGYNAGEGAVARWCEEAEGTPLDLFVERIPYNQTRGYTKRVISTYAVYRFLYSDAPKILRLDLNIP